MVHIEADASHYDIFLELAGELRRLILFRLNERSLKLSQLAKELNATIQEAHRNATRLIEAGLIQKDPEGLLSITTYGKMVTKQVPSFKFLAEHKQYFEEHTLGDLPMKFIQRIGALSNCDVITGVVAILEKWKTMYRDANEHIREIMAQVPLDLIEPLASRIRQGVKFSYIFGENTIIPKGRLELLRKIGWNKYIAEGIVERRMVDKVQVMVIVTENHAGVLFPNTKGETDMNYMFFSKDPIFHEWCLDFFRYKWYGSDLFDETKLREV
jgi:predicted transcriptional regulator